jgi:hypothetical protein
MFWNKNYFYDFFFQNPLHFHTDWLILESLATKANLNQIQKYFGFSLLVYQNQFFETPCYAPQKVRFEFLFGAKKKALRAK